MVVGDGERMPCAIIQPDFNYAKIWAKNNNIELGSTNEEIANNKYLKDKIEVDIDQINTNLGNWEQIKKIELTPEPWTIEDGLLTPTLKLKRKAIKEKYINLYNKMYGF